MNRQFKLMAAAFVLAAMHIAHAAVPEEQAAKLGQSLTPLGAQKAGNADGSIPAWTGQVMLTRGEKIGDVPKALFPDEQPVLSISATNMDAHKARLTEGTIALMQRYPKTFRIDVYPTHRTAVAPDYVYENTRQNATRCTLTEDKSLEGCYGGIPFPIPKSGLEVIWNHLLRVEPESIEMSFKNIVGASNGMKMLATQNEEAWQYPYYYRDGNVDDWEGEYWLQRFYTVAPPFKAGESLVIRDGIDPDTPRQAWQYMVGQRRVRRAPTVGYDTPDFVSSGANYFDEVMGFMGHPGRYDWKLVGKQEMYIPYNANRAVTAPQEAAYMDAHLNPDVLRWELHRVWVVEATVAEGERHAVPRRMFYFDEDTWQLVLMDGYDRNGKLWRTSQVTPFYVPGIPAVTIKPVTVFDLRAQTFCTVQALNGERYRVVEPRDETYFTGDAVAAETSR